MKWLGTIFGWITFLFSAQGTLINMVVHGLLGFILLWIEASFFGFWSIPINFVFLYIGGTAVLLCQMLGKSKSDQTFVEQLFNGTSTPVENVESSESADKPESSKEKNVNE